MFQIQFNIFSSNNVLSINKLAFVSHLFDIILWHCHLVYAFLYVIKKVLNTSCISYNDSLSNIHYVCVACQMGKSHALPYSSFLYHANTSIKVMHSNI